MTFHFSANATLEAANLDDAFIRLANHFLSLRLGKQETETGLGQTGIIEIKPESPDQIIPMTKVSLREVIQRTGEILEVRELLTAAKAVSEAEEHAILACPYKVADAIWVLRGKLKPFEVIR